MGKLQDSKYLSQNQYSTPDKLQARWKTHEFAFPKVDIYHHGIESLGLKGTESLLDVGCGDGSALRLLRSNGHKGRLAGVELNEKMGIRSESIDYVVGSADALPFEANSFDAVLSFFMLYHMADIQRTLTEWTRVLSPNGKLLVSTMGANSQPKHNALKNAIGRLLGKSAPARFSAPFNLANAEEQLLRQFTIDARFAYEGEFKYPTPQPYVDAFNTIRDFFEPTPTDAEWEKALRFVERTAQDEIQKTGNFTDTFTRGYFICTPK